jgi:hypothetical protein
MYLTINDVRHTVTRRLVSSDTIKYIGVTPEPDAVSGTISMYRNDGFLMSEDNAGKFVRKVYSGTVLLLTNLPEPSIEPFVPEPEPPSAKVVTAVVG